MSEFMSCSGCGNDKAYQKRIVGDIESCDRCAQLKAPYRPDVFFTKPYRDPNLVDPAKPSERNGVWIGSRAEKAMRMKRLGLREAGDKRHGARNFDAQLARRAEQSRPAP